MISAGVYLTRLLQAYGVEIVFGIPGVHTVELYRGLTSTSIRHISPRHEQGAGFMADGYARVSGNPGVCFIISGPGMTNIITAMAQAWSDSIPMLVISTVNAHGRMGSGDGWLHELPDQQALIKGVCAFSHTINHVAELPSVVARAFAVFDSERPRPVHIELPINIMQSPIGNLLVPGKVTRLTRPTACTSLLQEAADKLNQATSPLLLAGGGATRAASEVQSLAEKLDAPVVMTVNGRGIMPLNHPLAVSASPSLAATRALINTADVVLAVGTEFGSTDYDFNEDGLFSIQGCLIRIDIDPQQIMRTRIPEIGIVGDAASTVTSLREIVVQGSHQSAQRMASAFDNLAQEQSSNGRIDVGILECIRDTLNDVIIIGDSTQLVYAANNTYAPPAPVSYFNSATGYGTLGFGLPAAIGAKLAAPNRPVVSIVGDGGLQFSLAELASATDAKTNIIVLLHDNDGYGEIKRYMQTNSISPIGVDLFTPDFVAIGKACGWRAIRLDKLADLAEKLKQAVHNDTSTLLVLPESVRVK